MASNNRYRYGLVCVVVLAWAILLWGAGRALAQVSPDKEPEEPRGVLAAESLLHSVQNLLQTAGAQAKAGRLLVMAKYIAELAPEDVDVQPFLCNVYQIRKNYAAAAAAARKQLAVNPTDFETWKRWLQARLNMLNTATERIKFLRGVTETMIYSACQRSEAAMKLADLHISQGDQAAAQASLDKAINLDPLNSTALIGKLDLTKDAPAQMRCETMLALLRGNPRSAWVARQLAGYLGDHGLGELALQFLNHAWLLEGAGKPWDKAPPALAVEYAGALLDLGRAKEVVETFQPALVRLGSSLEFQALLVEAYDDLGDKTNAAKIRKQMARTYLAKITSHQIELDMKAAQPGNRQVTADIAADMAWFYMLLQPNPREALKYAREAAKLGSDIDRSDVILGCAELSSAMRSGYNRIEPLADKFPMAAYFLARHELGVGNVAAGRKYLLAGLAVAHKSLPYRLLARLAKKHNVPVPPVVQADIVERTVKSLDPAVLRMGLKPEEFIAITARPLASVGQLGEPIVIRATLTNVGKLPVKIGTWGLVDNRLAVVVSVGKDEQTRTFAAGQVLSWPAPGVLEPGKSVTAKIRLDTGALGEYLARQPLETIVLKVQSLVSPQERPGQIISGAPSVNPLPMTVRRIGILAGPGGNPAKQYSDALSKIAQRQIQSSLAQRMLAARQVASLLKWYSDVETQQATLPRSLRPVARKDALLGMMSQSLADSADVVRAEMLAGLAMNKLDGATLNLLGLVIADPSELVRFRVVELLGDSGNKGNIKMLDIFAKDKNKFVKLLAKAFLRAEARSKN